VRPVCEASGIEPGGYSRGVSEALVEFGAHESFERAAQRLARHYPVSISDTTLRKHTLQAGQKARAQQEPRGGTGALPAQGPECIEAQADGTMLPMLHFKEGAGDKRKRRQTHWQEQRLSVTRAQGSAQAHYACNMENVEELGRAWAASAKQTGWALNTQLHVVADAASWIGQQARQNFGRQARVLVDYYHLSEYLAAVAQRHKPDDKTWLARQQTRLKKGNYRQVIKQLEALEEPQSEPDEFAVARNAKRYLSNRTDQLWYDEALAQGRSIGSGLIEGAHRHVLQQRLKLSGAWWLPDNAKAMSHLRVQLANNAFHELFPLAT
jgi:hypothetical protein